MKIELCCGRTFDISEATVTTWEFGLGGTFKFPCGCELDIADFKVSKDLGTNTIHITKANNEAVCGLLSGMLVPFKPTEPFPLCHKCEAILEQKMTR